MADISLFLNEYKSYLSTFKETSFDNNNNTYLCKDETHDVINFDKLIQVRYPDSNKRPKSFDAVYIHEDIIFCIEFKNQKKPDKKEVEEKLLNGKKELESILSDLNIAKNNYKFIFCLVYNKFVPIEQRYKRGLYKSLSFEFLNQYKDNSFIDDVYTEDIDFFSRQFKKQFQKELIC